MNWLWIKKSCVRNLEWACSGLLVLVAAALITTSPVRAQTDLPEKSQADLQIELDLDKYRNSPMGAAFPFEKLFETPGGSPLEMGNADFSKLKSVRIAVELPEDVGSVMAAGMNNGALPMEFRVELDMGDAQATADAKEYFDGMSEGSDEVGGKEYLRMPNSPPNMGVVFPGGNLVVFGTDAYLGRIGQNVVSEQTSKLWASLPATPLRIAGDLSGSETLFRELDQMMGAMAPPEMQDVLAVLPGVASLLVQADANSAELLAITLNARTDGDMEEVGGLLEMLKMAIQSGTEEESANAPEGAENAVALMKEIAGGIEITSSGTQSKLTVAAPDNFVQRLKTDVEPMVRKAAEKAMHMNDLMQVVLAMHNYESAFRRFPQGPDSKGVNLSWRVKILPFLEEQVLYNRIDMEQDWDSEANKFLADAMPKIYGGGGRESLIAAVTLDKQPAEFRDLTDGTSNTIAFVRLNKPIPWAANRDLTIDEVIAMFDSMDGKGEVLVALYDGSVQVLPANVDRDKLRAMLTPDGGEVIDW